jgi:L-fuculose-phosphate aldolase
VSDVERAAESVLAAVSTMVSKGLTEGTAGNVSVRLADGNVLITPSGINYATMAARDLSIIDRDGAVVDGDRPPSSEKLLHLACYRAFDDVGAVIHAHPIFATMFAVAHQPIPVCIDEVSMYCGGDIRVADYAMSGTPEVADNAVAALHGRSAALLANHGTVAVGTTPERAVHVTALVERAAQIVWGARALGPIHGLPPGSESAFAAIYLLMRAAKGD